ncbi:CPCC family cysteine-rich protein [Streptomyces tritici]|uniref:CPCC family cysteine-rich protein n=1 Tax=Streptomyces tritici TaxID=2054410 RepID=UPI003AEF222E
MSAAYPCPCRGHRVLDAMPGSYGIRPVCFREDDGVQFRRPTVLCWWLPTFWRRDHP